MATFVNMPKPGHKGEPGGPDQKIELNPPNNVDARDFSFFVHGPRKTLIYDLQNREKAVFWAKQVKIINFFEF